MIACKVSRIEFHFNRLVVRIVVVVERDLGTKRGKGWKTKLSSRDVKKKR